VKRVVSASEFTRVVGMVAAGIALAACGSSGNGVASSSSGASTTPGSNATKLAGVGGDPAAAGAIQAHLSSLATKCIEGETALAGLITFAYADLKQNRAAETMPAVVANIDKSVPAGSSQFDCQGAIAAFLVQVEPAG
jgi:hypothetical protein